MAERRRDASSCPTFKGRPGWEFTDLRRARPRARSPAPDGGDLDAVPAGAVRAARRRDRARPGRRRGRPRARRSRTARSCCRCRSPASATPSSSSRTSARVVAADDVFTALNEAALGRRRVRLRPARRARRGPDPADRRHRRRRHRAAAARADRARGGRRGRGLGAVPVRRRRVARRCSTPSSSCVVGQNATPALRLRPGPQREVVDLRRPARRGGARRLARLGRRSASARRQRQGAHGDAARRRGRRRARSPAPTRRTAASTSTSTPRRSTAAPNTTSDLAFRGILADRSSAVWRGMIKVDPGAQQTDAFQECRNLLLSKKAHADAIPGLEILANDVRCTHAAAIAQIDQEQLFYLRSRGLRRAGRQAARDRGLHGRAGRALRGGPDPRGPGGRARAPAGGR